jgi:anti-sigma regulatory factor (Ser/Thr protein kinase)
MHTMAPGRAAELKACRVRLVSEPAAVAEARDQVRAAIASWDAPVDQDVAVLLTGELAANAVKHAAGETFTLGVRCTRDRLRVDVHDRSSAPPVLMHAPADAEAGRGLVLVDDLSAEWGFYPTPMGKVVYFTLTFQPDLTGTANMTSDERTSHPGPPNEDPGRPSVDFRQYQPQRRTNEARGPCRYCSGRGDAHKLWCRLLRLPHAGEPPINGEPPR